MKKKAQQTGSQAAIVVGIITLLIVFYIMFLPPEDRAALLGPSTSSTSGTSGTAGSTKVISSATEIVFSRNIGALDYHSLDSYEYDLSAVQIFNSESTQILGEISNVFVKNSWFDKTEREFKFTVDDPEALADITLSATLQTFSGSLIIYLNGKEVYNYLVTQANLDPISIKTDELNKGENTLTFAVSDVGVRFWRANEINIDDARIIAKIKDSSRSQTETTFYIPDEQSQDIESASLRFSPDCQPESVGKLTIELNDKLIFNGIPDCATLNKLSLSPEDLDNGQNTLFFSTEKGNYLIDQISVQTQLKKTSEPTYYFDLDKDLFKSTEEDIHRCGETDGYCPEDCGEDVDKDCCFQKYVDGYWCNVKTDYIDDRCVGKVDEGTCGRCPSGYKDKNDHVADACEGLCGDDRDGDCPVNCKPKYDKDCCFDQSGDQFWCNDLPITGEDFTCVDSLTYDSCKYCLSGYDGESSNPKCEYDKQQDTSSDELKDGIHVVAEFKFTEEGETKEATLYVNGHQSGFETRGSDYEKWIDDFVEPGTNSLRIVPLSNLEIRSLVIKIEK